jgi:hypothetical protein
MYGVRRRTTDRPSFALAGLGRGLAVIAAFLRTTSASSNVSARSMTCAGSPSGIA